MSIITAETYTVYEGQRLNAVSNSAFYDSVYLINHVFKDDALFSRVVKYGLMVDLCVAKYYKCLHRRKSGETIEL